MNTISDEILTAYEIIRRDGRVPIGDVYLEKVFVINDIRIRIISTDGWYLRISHHKDSAYPLYFRDTGMVYDGDYSDITKWIGEHYK